MANTAGVPKAKAAQLLGPIDHVLMQLGSNLTFVADTFDKRVETKIETAKIEMHGCMNAVPHRMGAEAVAKEYPLMRADERKNR